MLTLFVWKKQQLMSLESCDTTRIYCRQKLSVCSRQNGNSMLLTGLYGVIARREESAMTAVMVWQLAVYKLILIKGQDLFTYCCLSNDALCSLYVLGRMTG